MTEMFGLGFFVLCCCAGYAIVHVANYYWSKP